MKPNLNKGLLIISEQNFNSYDKEIVLFIEIT